MPYKKNTPLCTLCHMKTEFHIPVPLMRALHIEMLALITLVFLTEHLQCWHVHCSFERKLDILSFYFMCNAFSGSTHMCLYTPTHTHTSAHGRNTFISHIFLWHVWIFEYNTVQTCKQNKALWKRARVRSPWKTSISMYKKCRACCLILIRKNIQNKTKWGRKENSLQP